MFWAKEEEENSLVQLLKSEKFTLEDVLLNEFVVQDSRYGKAELINYITKKENLVALLNLSLNPVIDPNVPMKHQYRLSFIASEILTIRGTDVFQQLIVSTEETRKVLSDFLHDKTPLTHLVAGFFAKIMECLLSRQFAMTFAILQDSPFFDKCLENIHLGAIECLLENIVRIPNNSDGTRAMKQWMIDDNLFEKVVSRLRSSPCDDDRECLAEVYSEILRELRDKLYMVDNKEDALHDKAMETDLITKIADNLLTDDCWSVEELKNKSALISSSAKILETYMKTNLVPDAPAHHLEEIERALLEERHYSYGLMRPIINDDNFEPSYQPDPERLVEGIVANRAFNILKTVLRDIEEGGAVWQPLLRLFIELCNTNHASTHEKIAAAMQQLPFVKLIEAAKKKPFASVLHALLVKVVALLTHTLFPHSRETISPAAEYLLGSSGLINNIYETACSFHTSGSLIACSGLRTFNQNLGDTIYRAKQSTMAQGDLIDILKRDPNWAELEDIVTNYNGKNRPQCLRDYNDSSVLTTSVQSAAFNDSEEWTDASARFAEFDASSSTPARRIPNVFDFDVNLQRFQDLEPFDDTPDEDEFKKLCSERANSSSCSKNAPAFDDGLWPGEEPKKDETADSTCAIEFSLGDEGLLDVEEDEWVWPSEPPSGESTVVTQAGPRPDNVWVNDSAPDLSHLEMNAPQTDDMWADFSSFPSVNPSNVASTSAAAFAWPGTEVPEQGESSDWPLSGSHDSKPSDPATVGLAASISPPKDADSSDA